MREEERREKEQKRDGGLVDKALDMARKRGMVDEAQVQKAREKGLVDKANGLVDKVKGRFSGR